MSAAGVEAFRAEARAWLTANVPTDLPSGDTAEGFARHVEWERTMFAAGWSVVAWPTAYGGRDASLREWLIFEEEYYRAGGPPRVTQNGIFLLAPTLFEFGTAEQRDHLLPRMAAAEDLWCQGWSEPGAGSDLAAISSRAVRDEAAGGWRLTGQKTWTTRGAFCTHLFGLFRTGGGEGRRHDGLTYFLVPLDAPGVRVRGFERLDGDEGFAEVFLDDVFVPDSGVLGEVGRGWQVAMATTGSERGLTLRSPGRFLASADRLVELARGRDAVTAVERDAVVDAWIGAQAYHEFTQAQVERLTGGGRMGPESSLNKLFWSQLDIRLHEAALDLLGPDAELDGPWSRGFLFSLAGPIYAGTNEIQRTIVAERVLGLPRR
ncbi:acyl-CoA dehydrogenase family protein [Solwaraspora sp. WMMD1047]|uniref:acyl-CoA dehydrogenase family protein n=1 Tax=Solwaraspora sp. WMMD1047 TaxID=3016102 RepID=UPI002417C686|nr:acyl-CoA dehydrogenase family protein [Solwaraspora sp. WMMD1047]MDG4834388.1 acyl-CoA dehydrogenase family protein [Solwaraspora sp. WMMD1047]